MRFRVIYGKIDFFIVYYKSKLDHNYFKKNRSWFQKLLRLVPGKLGQCTIVFIIAVIFS